MVKRMKFDDSGDLQALFDSIATAPPRPRLEVVEVVSGDGEGDDLQSLFDAVASEFNDTVEVPAVPPPPPPVATEEEAAQGVEGHGRDALFARIGHMTRQLHDTLRALDCDPALQEAIRAVADPGQRLNHLGRIAEQAVGRVLKAADIVRPIQDSLLGGAEDLHARWDRLYANQLSAEEFKALAAETRDFLGRVAEGSRATHAQVLDVVMAQGLQALTGQAMTKVVAMARQLEAELLQVLLEAMPEDGRAPVQADRSPAREDGVNSQTRVDDWLKGLGF